MADRILYDKSLVVKYKEGDVSILRTEENLIDDINDKIHIVQDGERITTIADFYYGSSSYWFIISDKNIDVIDNPFELISGKSLIIPNKLNL